MPKKNIYDINRGRGKSFLLPYPVRKKGKYKMERRAWQSLQNNPINLEWDSNFQTKKKKSVRNLASFCSFALMCSYKYTRLEPDSGLSIVNLVSSFETPNPKKKCLFFYFSPPEIWVSHLLCFSDLKFNPTILHRSNIHFLYLCFKPRIIPFLESLSEPFLCFFSSLFQFLLPFYFVL